MIDSIPINEGLAHSNRALCYFSMFIDPSVSEPNSTSLISLNKAFS